MNPLAYMVFALLSFLTACASSQGLHLNSLQQTLQDEEARFVGVLPSTSIANTPTRQGPQKLGLYVKPTGFLRHEFEWTDRDRDSILAWAQGLSVTQAGFIPLSSLKGNTLAQLRDSAARYGADLLVTFDGAAAVDRYNNYKAPLLYWTILGAYFADGTHSDALCLVRGSVWDVKTGILLASEEAEGRAQAVGPAAFVDDRTVVLTAHHQALATLLTALKERLLRPQNP
jgi:hypothetical protein